VVRRICIANLTAARGLSGKLLAFVIVGIVGNGLLAAVEGGALDRAVNDQSWQAPFKLTTVSIPAYFAPVKGTAIVCDLLLDKEPLGKALLLFLLAVGLNLGTLVWIASSYGFRTLIVTSSIIVGAALAIDYCLPLSLPSAEPGPQPSQHFLEIESSATPRM